MDELRVPARVSAAWRRAATRREAEVRIDRPGFIGLHGPARDAVLDLRDESVDDLADADARLRSAADDRAKAVSRIRACSLAIVGTGQVVDPATGAVWQPGRHRRPVLFEDPLPDPETLRPLSGAELRAAACDVLAALRRPATVAEVQRLLAAHGLRPTGRPSQTLSNALRFEARAGRVVRHDRNRYEAAAEDRDLDVGPGLGDGLSPAAT